MWKHLLLIFQYIFSRNGDVICTVCPIWSFIFDTGQAQINSAGIIQSAVVKGTV